MWYVIWATTGREELTRIAIEKNIDSSLYSRLSIPHIVKLERKAGVDREVVRRILPSYIFVETVFIQEFANKLKHMPGFSVVLHNEGYWPLSDDEQKTLLSLIKDGDIIDISSGFMENGRVKVISGPLTGAEGFIKKINVRKRLARVEIDMFGTKIGVDLGLKILEQDGNKY